MRLIFHFHVVWYSLIVFKIRYYIHIYDSLKNISKFNYEITCKEKLNYKKRHKLLLRRLKFNLISVAFHYARTRRSWAPIGPKDSFALQFADACKPRLTFLAAGISMDDDGCGRINCKLGERRANFQMLLSLNSDWILPSGLFGNFQLYFFYLWLFAPQLNLSNY